MKALWLAHLFSLNCTATLSEFFTIQEAVNSGTSIFDPHLVELSSAWSDIRQDSFPMIKKMKFEEFCREIEAALERGIKFSYPGQEDFPKELLTLNEIPFFLTYKGTPVWKKSVGFSVVGSREPSADSEAWCEKELSQLLSVLPLYTVSGGARGVDQICHRVSVRLGLPTVAFLPSGVEQIYPASLEVLTEAILSSGGALVSEYLPKTSMKKQFFQRRNRLIAGLGQVCLIIEAKRRSGTLITALQALEQSKPLLVLPSHPYDGRALGGLDLLLDGATPVRDAEDLVNFLAAELKGRVREDRDLVAEPHH